MALPPLLAGTVKAMLACAEGLDCNLTLQLNSLKIRVERNFTDDADLIC